MDARPQLVPDCQLQIRRQLRAHRVRRWRRWRTARRERHRLQNAGEFLRGHPTVRPRRDPRRAIAAASLVVLLAAGACGGTTGSGGGAPAGGATVDFLNASYDPTRELYVEF